MKRTISNSTLIVGGIVVVAIFLMLTHSDKKPCNQVLAPFPTYLNDLSSYRQHEIQDAISDVQDHNGDKFDVQAARLRVLAVPDEQLDNQRKSELAFTTKVYENARKDCSQ